mmetsp:Transcript_19340/g.63029  ORF Transcript_19340/g.63029 Transcript_19340/m.63029 type:complete len:336 (-) Transcript_19340:235-1242(-)
MASASNTANMSARDRAKQRELAEARQNGQAAPEVDVNSGAMINPHNPDFITKRPWYLGDSGPSLQHHDTRGAATASEVSMAEADAHLRRRRGAWEARVGGGAVAVVEVGAWIEALYRGKTPWLPARVAKVRLDGSLDLEFENGRTSQKVPRAHAKLPKAGAGARSGLESLGKVAYDAKRDRWHGYDPSMHKETEDRYAELDAARARRKDKRQDARSKEARAAAKAERKQAKAAEKAAGGGDDDDDDGLSRKAMVAVAVLLVVCALVFFALGLYFKRILAQRRKFAACVVPSAKPPAEVLEIPSVLATEHAKRKDEPQFALIAQAIEDPEPAPQLL